MAVNEAFIGQRRGYAKWSGGGMGVRGGFQGDQKDLIIVEIYFAQRENHNLVASYDFHVYDACWLSVLEYQVLYCSM